MAYRQYWYTVWSASYIEIDEDVGVWVIEGQDGLTKGGVSSLDDRRTAIVRIFTGLSMCLIDIDLYLARNAIKMCPPLTLTSRELHL